MSPLFFVVILSSILLFALWKNIFNSTANVSAPFVGTEPKIVKRMLDIAEFKKGDTLYDLGSGDGRLTWGGDGQTKFELDAVSDASIFQITQTGVGSYFNIDTSGATDHMVFGNAGVPLNFLFAGGGEIRSTGPIRFTEQSGDPTNVANTGFVYTKDDSGDTELYWEDDDGNKRYRTEIKRNS